MLEFFMMVVQHSAGDEAAAATHQGALQLRVAPGQAGRRIDNFLLARCRGVPRSRIYQMLRRGEVRVNGGRVRAGHRIQAGDRLRLPPMHSDPEPRPPPGGGRLLTGCLLYADDSLLVVNKPAGLAVHSGSGCPHGLIEMLHGVPEGAGLHLVHRLDRWTSGCLLLARDLPALRALHEQWHSNQVQKRYQVLLSGQLRGSRRRIDAPLRRGARRGGERLVTVDRSGGRAALSDFHISRRFTGATLVTVRLRTGRTHQIRVHARHIGHPVAGDSRYAMPEENRRFRALGLKRPFLHAHSLRFTSPATGGPVHVDAPLPEELGALLKQLRPWPRRY